jgi:ABC-type sulfate transport system permease component
LQIVDERMPLKNRLVVVLALPLLAFLSLPLVGLLGRSSISEVWQALGSDAVQQALGLSIMTSAITFGSCVWHWAPHWQFG